MEWILLETPVTFLAEGFKIAGVIRVPDGIPPGERRPAFVILHGFGSNMTAGNVAAPNAMLEALGYITLRFDMRGCGLSEGPRGRLICMEQVEDTRAAIGVLINHPQVDPERIGVLGSSYGASVAIYTAAIDPRFAVVVSASGFGNGYRKSQAQHQGEEAWAKFMGQIERGKEHKARTGEVLMMDRYDIVPIPQKLRGHLAESSILSFPYETAESILNFIAEDVIGQIAPRPVLLLHSADDSVTPTEQSIELFKRAGQPTDLHLFGETDHFMFAEHNVRVRQVVVSWLEKFFPVIPVAKAAPTNAH